METYKSNPDINTQSKVGSYRLFSQASLSVGGSTHDSVSGLKDTQQFHRCGGNAHHVSPEFINSLQPRELHEFFERALQLLM
jgi:hypothetical protein